MSGRLRVSPCLSIPRPWALSCVPGHGRVHPCGELGACPDCCLCSSGCISLTVAAVLGWGGLCLQFAAQWEGLMLGEPEQRLPELGQPWLDKHPQALAWFQLLLPACREAEHSSALVQCTGKQRSSGDRLALAGASMLFLGSQQGPAWRDLEAHLMVCGTSWHLPCSLGKVGPLQAAAV